jgi:hypothetical protein
LSVATTEKPGAGQTVSLVGSVMRAVAGCSRIGCRKRKTSSAACWISFNTSRTPSRIARTTGPSTQINSPPRGM